MPGVYLCAPSAEYRVPTGNMMCVISVIILKNNLTLNSSVINSIQSELILV